MKKKVFVGISGGVDSAVAASLLLDQGYDVYGVFMKNWSGEDYGVGDECPWKEDLESAKEVCDFLGIDLRVYNFETEYRDKVIEDFFTQYELGNTPNPDILCNKFIKFDAFLKRAIDEGADYIATGHYAVIKDARLYKAKDTNKDQTYFLSQVTSEQLSKSLFPLGDMDKPEVREYAKKKKLPNADRKDSQGICFIGKVDINEFLNSRIKEKTGDIIDIDSNEKVGEHIGVWFYTLGQRKGIQIGGLSEPYFVAKKDPEKNLLYVAKGKKHDALWGTTVTVKDFKFINPEDDFEGELEGIVRYRGVHTSVKIAEITDSTAVFEFSEPQWTPTPGQSVVIYSEGECLGGGIII